MLAIRQPSHLALTVILGIAATVGGGGCYATHSVAPEVVGALRRGSRSREVVLRSGERGHVRIGPGSWVRFRRVDGAMTAWVEAKTLHVAPDCLVVGSPRVDDALVLRWDDLQGVEVNDVDAGRTAIGIVAGTSMVILAAAAELTVVVALSALTGGHFNGDVGITRGAFEAVLDKVGERPENDPDALAPSDQPDDALNAINLIAASPLFAAEARRRDIVRFGAGVEMGLESGGGVLRSEATVNAGLRLLNVLEVSGGLSMLGSPLGANDGLQPTLPTTGNPGATRLVPRARLGLHLDLDANRRIALALGQQVGISTGGWVDLRTDWGVRLRVSDRFQLGIHPFNPRVTWQNATVGARTTYVSAVELDWLM